MIMVIMMLLFRNVCWVYSAAFAVTALRDTRVQDTVTG